MVHLTDRGSEIMKYVCHLVIEKSRRRFVLLWALVLPLTRRGLLVGRFHLGCVSFLLLWQTDSAVAMEHSLLLCFETLPVATYLKI